MFVYGFAKSERGNIKPEELVFWRRIAATYLAMTDAAIKRAIADDELKEVMCNGEVSDQ